VALVKIKTLNDLIIHQKNIFEPFLFSEKMLEESNLIFESETSFKPKYDFRFEGNGNWELLRVLEPEFVVANATQ